MNSTLLTSALLLACVCAAEGRAVWIDTDPSVQKGAHEVDDGFALVQAFRSKELEIRGISVVFGNAPLDRAWPIGQDLLRRYGPPNLPLYKGAAGADELGHETEASRALAAALKKERLTVLVLGPATNIATVLKNHPELSSRFEQIIAVAGRRPGQRFRTSDDVRSFRDLNFELDAPAFQVILDSGVKLVLAPWEISSKVWMTSQDLDALLKGDPSLDFIIDAARDWLAFWKRDLKTDGFNPFDTLAIGYAISPSQFRCDELAASIQQLPDDTESSSAPKKKPYLLVEKSQRKNRTVTYCHDAGPKFKDDLMSRLRKGSRTH